MSKTKCAHQTEPGDLDLPSMKRMYLDLDRGRRLSVSAWCPSVRIEEAVMLTVEGTLFWRNDEGEFGEMVALAGDWEPGDTEAPRELIVLEDGRELFCKSWKVEPAGRDRGQAIGGGRGREIQDEAKYQATHVTMECYLMQKDDPDGSGSTVD